MNFNIKSNELYHLRYLVVLSEHAVMKLWRSSLNRTETIEILQIVPRVAIRERIMLNMNHLLLKSTAQKIHKIKHESLKPMELKESWWLYEMHDYLYLTSVYLRLLSKLGRGVTNLFLIHLKWIIWWEINKYGMHSCFIAALLLQYIELNKGNRNEINGRISHREFIFEPFRRGLQSNKFWINRFKAVKKSAARLEIFHNSIRTLFPFLKNQSNNLPTVSTYLCLLQGATMIRWQKKI